MCKRMIEELIDLPGHVYVYLEDEAPTPALKHVPEHTALRCVEPQRRQGGVTCINGGAGMRHGGFTHN